MDKVKKYILYIALIALFALFSNLLIAVGLNANYKDIERKQDNLSQVEIYQAEATKVNGRIRGIINNKDNKIEENYLKIEFFTARDVNMGSKYIEIDHEKEEIPIEAFFKLNNVASYKISLVNEKDPQGEIELIPKELNKKEIWIATFFAVVLFL
ncbi:MAG: hypothetical protein J5881_04125 [Clostridia bacterium]|nr:hypothetical protein [Clostridia bacterium]